MRNASIGMVLVIVAAGLGVSACGGGSGGGAAFIPQPPPPPPPPPPVTATDFLKTGGVSQEFASKGATYNVPTDRKNADLADSDQLKLSYDAASNTYRIQLPGSNQLVGIAPVAGEAGSWSTADSVTTLSAQPGDS